MEAPSDAERLKAFAPVQEMMTYVQFANDECDYGMGLELGMDLFCHGSHVSEHTLPPPPSPPPFPTYTLLLIAVPTSSTRRVWIQLEFQNEHFEMIFKQML